MLLYSKSCYILEHYRERRNIKFRRRVNATSASTVCAPAKPTISIEKVYGRKEKRTRKRNKRREVEWSAKNIRGKKEKQEFCNEQLKKNFEAGKKYRPK